MMMTLTKKQRDNIEAFLDIYADVESALKRKLGKRGNDLTAMKSLIEAYETKNPYWRDSANQLRTLSDIRNLLTHQRGTEFGYPIAIAPFSLNALHKIREHLIKPEPASLRYRTTVMTVLGQDSLASVLSRAFENGFSQFPVLSGERFGGLITENAITRWLGRQTKDGAANIDLNFASVKNVLKEKDPFRKGIPIFHFAKLDAPAQEVMGRFLSEPALEAVLLTRSGSKDSPIEGIITQWDAARYQG